MNLYSSFGNPDQKRSGFTLIELLVVIAIIAILAAILFPVFASAKIAAKKAVSISNSKQMGLGCMMYANDYDDTAVPLTNGPDGTNAFTGLPYTWEMLLDPYVKNYDLYAEPIDGSQNESQWVQNANDWGLGIAEPLSGYQRDYLRTFFGSWGYNYVFFSPIENDTTQVREGVSLTMTSNPANQIMLVSGMTSYSTGTWPNCHPVRAGYYAVDPPSIQGSMNTQNSWNQGWYLEEGMNGDRTTCDNWNLYNAFGATWPRYNASTTNGAQDPGQVNVCHADGHVKGLSVGQMLEGAQFPFHFPESARGVTNEATYRWGYGQ